MELFSTENSLVINRATKGRVALRWPERLALGSTAIASSSIVASLLNPTVPSRVDVTSNEIAISYSRLSYTHYYL
jgi:hypothetical protein